MIATLALSLVLAHGAHTLPPPTVHELPRAERATGRTVLCVSDKRMDWLSKFWHEKREAAGVWVPQDHVIVITGSLCSSIAHPRKDRWQAAPGDRKGLPPAEPLSLASAIFLLGHEAAHARQQDLGIPFSEHQADCWSKAGFQTLKQRLRIRMRVSFAMTGLRLRCS